MSNVTLVLQLSKLVLSYEVSHALVIELVTFLMRVCCLPDPVTRDTMHLKILKKRRKIFK